MEPIIAFALPSSPPSPFFFSTSLAAALNFPTIFPRTR